MVFFEVDFHIYQNVDIKFTVHDAFLEQASSGTLLTKRLESQIM
jgi:hypothetical protein